MPNFEFVPLGIESDTGGRIFFSVLELHADLGADGVDGKELHADLGADGVDGKELHADLGADGVDGEELHADLGADGVDGKELHADLGADGVDGEELHADLGADGVDGEELHADLGADGVDGKELHADLGADGVDGEDEVGGAKVTRLWLPPLTSEEPVLYPSETISEWEEMAVEISLPHAENVFLLTTSAQTCNAVLWNLPMEPFSNDAGLSIFTFVFRIPCL